MNDSLKKKTIITGKYSRRRLFYTFCFLMFCIIDQRTKTGSGRDGIIETFREATGIVLACIIFSHYKWADFVKYKWVYTIWGVVSVIGSAVVFFRGMSSNPFLNDRIAILANVVIWGPILIHTFIQVVLEKQYPKLNKRMLIVWTIMMVLMMVSRSHYIWPFCYMVMFGCFYFTGFTQEEQSDLWQGCLDGIILSFLLFQGFCCMFRPYDVVRYQGIHNNCNLNAVYYMAVLVAAFTKILYVTRCHAAKWVKVIYWLLAGVVLSFLFMTIGRIAWITAFVLGLVFLGLLNLVLQKKRFIKNGMVLVLCAVLMFPIAFGATRYLPPVFHHPIWFWGEWSEDKVHSWDAWNSEKYIDLDEFLEVALGRVADSVYNLLEHSPFAIKADAAELLPEEGDPRVEAAILRPEQSQDDFLIRATIYQHYFKHLNWRGHPYEEQGFQLFWYYWIGHAHNIFLQYGTDFGIPVMILFATLVVWGIVVCWKRSKKQACTEDMAALFYILIPVVFGLFEYSWGVGSLSITMLFIAWGRAMQKET
ncbi:MAG: hypothetical protein NC094_07540 [Bacteroidales bacterium]|nr:hypothetical protein [Lachnoclostridium sp.]MCM1384734.1 hypothetical protein [Lachnoclostridium sp.]MCM1465252.1 hypothetical protein [Bacteroidales bacterium]